MSGLAVSREWLQVGESALDAADVLYRSGHFRSCVSRSYYAAYSFLAVMLVLQVGVNFRDEREGPEHEPLSDLVAAHLRKTLPASVRSRIRTGIRTLYEARLVADYRPREAVTHDLAVQSLKTATTIANAVRERAP